jgi:pyruvate/2-oxoglutarate dehydrogenase complex dihydrolipoamide dehydrogenase (E3) component
VVEAGAPLVQDDRECAAIVLDALRREGVAVRSGVAVKEVRRDGDEIVAVLRGEKEETVAATHLLLAAGRRPNSAGLDLEDARIRTADGRIVVDGQLRTTNRRVYAIGDVAGGRFTHVANYHAGLVVRNALFRLPVKVDYSAVPWVTYTDPELAHVGLGEAEARKRGYVIRVLRWPYNENDRAEIEREGRGHIKVVTTGRGRILGVTIVGPQAGELIAVWALAIKERLPIRALAELTAPYPTLGEIGKRAAMAYYTDKLTSPTVRRIMGWVRRLG